MLEWRVLGTPQRTIVEQIHCEVIARGKPV